MTVRVPIAPGLLQASEPTAATASTDASTALTTTSITSAPAATQKQPKRLRQPSSHTVHNDIYTGSALEWMLHKWVLVCLLVDGFYDTKLRLCFVLARVRHAHCCSRICFAGVGSCGSFLCLSISSAWGPCTACSCA
jgi:hypothetical protein